MAPITDDDIAAGWRVVSVSSNAPAAATFTMPPHATVWEDARDFGAGWGSWKITFVGWRFTCGDVGWTNGFAWVEGSFRSRFITVNARVGADHIKKTNAEVYTK